MIFQSLQRFKTVEISLNNINRILTISFKTRSLDFFQSAKLQLDWRIQRRRATRDLRARGGGVQFGGAQLAWRSSKRRKLKEVDLDGYPMVGVERGMDLKVEGRSSKSSKRSGVNEVCGGRKMLGNWRIGFHLRSSGREKVFSLFFFIKILIGRGSFKGVF